MTRFSPQVRGFVAAFLGFAAFSSHDSLVKILGGGYSVFQLVFFINLFSFVPMTVIVLVDSKIDNFRPHHPWLLLLRGFLMVASMAGAFYAFSALPMAEVYALLFTTPLIVTILSIPLLGEVVRGQRWAAVFLGLVGVVIVVRPSFSTLDFGHMAALTAAVASASTSILIRKIGKEERSAVLILYPMLFSFAFMAILLPFVYKPIAFRDLAMMGVIAVLSITAQHFIIIAYRTASAALIAPVQYSQIVWAVILGALFFSEKPDRYILLGATIIILSGVFVVWRESRLSVSARTPVLQISNPRFDTGPSPRSRPRDFQGNG